MIKLLIAGDFCPHDRLSHNNILRLKVDDRIKDVIKDNDFSLVNFECPITNFNDVPIVKQGPSLSCSNHAINVVKQIGFTGLTLSNNHINDYGFNGIQNTIIEATNAGLDTVGVGKNEIDAARSLFLSKGDESIAIINFCENEFSVASSEKGGANGFNLVRQYYAIKDAKSSANYVVLIIHGGIEHFQLPSLRMKEVYRFFIDAGADAIINHHQHCYSGFEYYKEKPIFYGIGNFCFDWDGKRNCSWNEGFLVQLLFNGPDVISNTYPYKQCDSFTNIELLVSAEKDLFNRNINELNNVIKDDRILAEKLHEFYISTTREYILSLSPYSSKFFVSLFRRRLLPSFITKTRILRLFNFVLCESHFDRLKYFLQDEYKKIIYNDKV